MAPPGVETGSGSVEVSSETLESSSSSNFSELLSLLQVMLGAGMPVALHSNTATMPSLTVSRGGAVISGETRSGGGEREKF